MTAQLSWIQQAKQKIAPTQTKDDAAISEAFAQLACTAVGSSDRRIMNDSCLQGFEIVDKNVENNRLVGVFAFRVSGEILMGPGILPKRPDQGTGAAARNLLLAGCWREGR